MKILYRPRWPLLILLVGGIAALIGFAYFVPEPAGEELPARGGRYVEGVAGGPSRINPTFATFNQVDQDLVSLVFSGLVRLGPKGDIQPDLAEEWKVSPDALSYTFQLRQKVFWHDGEPFDAEDVLFTIETIQDAGFQGEAGLQDVFREVQVEAPDQHVVVVTLPEPFAPFLSYMTVGMLPQHLLGELDASEQFEAAFNQEPIGTGPFRLDSLTPEAATLKPFDAYHLGRPFLEEVEIRFYRDDPTLLNALITEEVDGALFRPGLDPEDIALIDGEARWLRRSLHTTAYSLVYLNPNVPAFDEVEARRALQQGLDRDLLIERALSGQAIPIDSPIIQDLWAYVGQPGAFRSDTLGAANLLDGAGWKRQAGGREKDGERLEFVLASSNDPVQSDIAAEIARQWRELGIEVDVELSGASQFVEDVLLTREFDAALVSVDPGPDPDAYPFWHSTQALGSGRNLTGFSNPEADRLLEDARQTPSDAERFADYQAFQEIFADELPAVLLYTPTYQYVVRSDLREVKPGLLLNLSVRFRDVHRWYLEKSATSDAES